MENVRFQARKRSNLTKVDGTEHTVGGTNLKVGGTVATRDILFEPGRYNNHTALRFEPYCSPILWVYRPTCCGVPTYGGGAAVISVGTVPRSAAVAVVTVSPVSFVLLRSSDPWRRSEGSDPVTLSPVELLMAGRYVGPTRSDSSQPRSLRLSSRPVP